MAYTTINKSTDNFNMVEWTGDATSSRNITGVGFQPDWTWIKCKDENYNHNIFDVVRGANKYILTDSNVAETTVTNRLNSWNADGFNIGDATNVNKGSPARNYIAWNWKAGTTSGIDTTGATITPSSYSFNATSKMSIIKYTGNDTNNAAVPHGLGVVPNCIIIKDLSGTEHWAVYHTGLTANKQLYLNLDNTEETSQFGSTANTSVLFHLGTNQMVNSSSKNYIAYCFADVSGYSKMGKYIGNSNANGTFVYTGFKPTCIIIKRINSSADWYIYDTTRSIYNSTANILYPSLNNVDYTGTGNTIDILSNGFKMRSTNGDSNGGTHIFYAVGQTIVGTNSVPATAR